MKKRILLFVFLLGIMTVTCFAQDNCKMCGTWIGKWNEKILNKDSDELELTQLKKIIRIDKYGEEYNIRIKIENPRIDHTHYEDDDITILYADDNSVRFKLTSDYEPDYVNHIITGYSIVERFYELYYKNGYVHLKRYAQIQYDYDMHKNFIRKWDAQELAGTGFGDDIDMYNEKDNW